MTRTVVRRADGERFVLPEHVRVRWPARDRVYYISLAGLLEEARDGKLEVVDDDG